MFIRCIWIEETIVIIPLACRLQLSAFPYFQNCDFNSISQHHANMSMLCTPPTPHFHTVKLGFTGVYIIFLFLLLNIDCAQSKCFGQKKKKKRKSITIFHLKIIIFTAVKNCNVLHEHVFVMVIHAVDLAKCAFMLLVGVFCFDAIFTLCACRQYLSLAVMCPYIYYVIKCG